MRRRRARGDRTGMIIEGFGEILRRLFTFLEQYAQPVQTFAAT